MRRTKPTYGRRQGEDSEVSSGSEDGNYENSDSRDTGSNGSSESVSHEDASHGNNSTSPDEMEVVTVTKTGNAKRVSKKKQPPVVNKLASVPKKVITGVAKKKEQKTAREAVDKTPEELSKLLLSYGIVRDKKFLKGLKRNDAALYYEILQSVQRQGSKFVPTSHLIRIFRFVNEDENPDGPGLFESLHCATDVFYARVPEPVCDATQTPNTEDIMKVLLADEGLSKEAQRHLNDAERYESIPQKLYRISKHASLLPSTNKHTNHPDRSPLHHIITNDVTREAFWLKEPGGLALLGAVVNMKNAKKLVPDTIEEHATKLLNLRGEILELIAQYNKKDGRSSHGKRKQRHDKKEKRSEKNAKTASSSNAAKRSIAHRAFPEDYPAAFAESEDELPTTKQKKAAPRTVSKKNPPKTSTKKQQRQPEKKTEPLVDQLSNLNIRRDRGGASKHANTTKIRQSTDKASTKQLGVVGDVSMGDELNGTLSDVAIDSLVEDYTHFIESYKKENSAITAAYNNLLNKDRGVSYFLSRYSDVEK